MKINRTIPTLAAASILALAGQASAENILIAGSEGVIRQLDTQSGEISVRGACAGPVSSMIVNNNTLYLGDNNGSVYTFDTTTNTLNGVISIPGDANALSWLGENLVIGDSSGSLSYYSTATNEIVATTVVPGTDITAIGLDAGGIFVGGHSTLAVRSHIGQDNYEFFAACGSMINSMAFGPQTMFLGGIAFGGAEAGTVYLFDKFAGGIEYSGTYSVDSDTTSMVVADGMLFIGGSDGIIHEMNPATGIIERTFDTGSDIQAMTPAAGLSSCPADYDASGELNFLDISQFIELFTEQLVPGDTNGDNQFNFFDVSEFIEIYSGGC